MILLAKSPGYIAVHTNAGNLVAIVPIETEKLSGTILKDATVGAHSSDRCGAFLISPAVSILNALRCRPLLSEQIHAPGRSRPSAICSIRPRPAGRGRRP